MTGALAALVRHDTRLQWRYGIYPAYAFVIAFYAATFLTLGDRMPNWLPAVIIYSDPAAVGFFFLGALMMLEKSESVRLALAITPVSAKQYFMSKVITLTGLSLVSVALLSPFVHWTASWSILLPAVALTSIAYLGVGILAARFFRTVTSYLIGSAGWLIPLILPSGLAFIEPMPAWAMFVPSSAQFRLILVATGNSSATPFELAIMFLVAAITAWAASHFAVRNLKMEFGHK